MMAMQNMCKHATYYTHTISLSYLFVFCVRLKTFQPPLIVKQSSIDLGTAETNFLTDKKGTYVVHNLVHNILSNAHRKTINECFLPSLASQSPRKVLYWDFCSEKFRFLGSELVFGANMGLVPHLSRGRI